MPLRPVTPMTRKKTREEFHRNLGESLARTLKAAADRADRSPTHQKLRALAARIKPKP